MKSGCIIDGRSNSQDWSTGGSRDVSFTRILPSVVSFSSGFYIEESNTERKSIDFTTENYDQSVLLLGPIKMAFFFTTTTTAVTTAATTGLGVSVSRLN